MSDADADAQSDVPEEDEELERAMRRDQRRRDGLSDDDDDDDEPDEGPPDFESSGMFDDAGVDPTDEDAIQLELLTAQLARLGGTATTTMRVKRVKPRKLADGTQISGFLIGFEFEPPYRPVEIMERLGVQLGSGTYKLVAVNGEGQYIRGGTSRPIDIQAGPAKAWTPPGMGEPERDGQFLDERSFAYKALERQLNGGGDDMNAVTQMVKESLRTAEAKVSSLENKLENAHRAERDLQTRVTKLESDVERAGDRLTTAEKETERVGKVLETAERDLRDEKKDNDKLEREVAKLELGANRDGPMEQLAAMQKLGLLGGKNDDPTVELYQVAMQGMAEEMPKIFANIAKMHGGGGDDKFSMKDVADIADKALDVWGKRVEARTAAATGAAAGAPAPGLPAPPATPEQQMAYREELRRRHAAAAAAPANGGAAPPRRRSRPRPPAGVSQDGSAALPASADPLASPGDAERAAEARASRPSWLGEPEPKPAVATVRDNPPAAAAAAPAPTEATPGFIDAEFLAEIERHVEAGVGGNTLAAVVDDWREKNDPRGAVVHEILLQACMDEPFENVLNLALKLASGRTKALLESDGGKRWFQQWCAFWNPEGNPGVLDEAKA